MQVPVQQFKSHLAEYIAKAQAGEVLELTSHRKVVARITGVTRSDAKGPARMVASGMAAWSGGKPEGSKIKLQSGGSAIAALVMEDRG